MTEDLKSPKELLASGEPLPEGVNVEDLPCSMNGDYGDPLEGLEGWHGPGWVRVSPMDRAGRRSLWYRTPGTIKAAQATDTDDGRIAAWKAEEEEVSPMELRAGREGDDSHIVLTEGDVISHKTLTKLYDALERGQAWKTDGS